MIRKIALLSIILCFISQWALAKKRIYPIQEITSIADLIVTGKIISVTGNTYFFSIDQTIKGKQSKQIIVKMFQEWTCDFRKKKAEIGQSLMLFLKANSKDSFEIINGSTGELFIINEKVEGIWGFEAESVNDVTIGLKNFLTCYIVLNKELFGKKQLEFKKLKTGIEILALKKISTFSNKLFEGMEKYRIVTS